MKQTVIQPKRTFTLKDIKELWDYRELLYFLTWRDLKVRYKQTALGVAWAIIQPTASMVIFTLFFGALAGVPSDGVPYPIFVYVGLLFWQLFSGALSETSSVLISHQAMITKVYFPRLALPFSTIVTKFVDFLIAGIVLIGLMIYYGYAPSLTGILLLPLLLLISFFASSGLGLFLASVNVKYRDVRYVLPFFMQMLLFLTPVIYPSSLAGKFAWLLSLNPMTGVIQTARASVFGTTSIDWMVLTISIISSIAFLLIGIAYFKKIEHYIADII